MYLCRYSHSWRPILLFICILWYLAWQGEKNSKQKHKAFSSELGIFYIPEIKSYYPLSSFPKSLETSTSAAGLFNLFCFFVIREMRQGENEDASPRYWRFCVFCWDCKKVVFQYQYQKLSFRIKSYFLTSWLLMEYMTTLLSTFPVPIFFLLFHELLK